MISQGCFYESSCFLFLCIPWLNIQRILSSCWNMLSAFPTVLYSPLYSWWCYPFLENNFWNGWCMPKVILSWYWCTFCMSKSVCCSALLAWWFEWIVLWLGFGILVHICLNSQAWYFLVNNLCQINFPRGICWYWNLLLCTCWRLFEALWWSCMHSLNW